MDSRLKDIFDGREENYLFPFYWQHGDHRHLIPEQVQRIYDSGCRALCVESRPHPDFCGESWWADFALILSEAKKRGMKVWLLDDDKFPTGHAAGMIGKKYPHLRQWELIERHIDVVGPADETAVICNTENEDNVFLGAYAYRRHPDDLETCDYEAIDLSDCISDGYLTWDIPEGVWRIFFYYRSRRGGNKDYIDVINPESVRVLIESVYESHYEHFSEYFGDTFVGFFSDEPQFGNQVYGQQRFDYGFYEARIGKPSLALPWNDTVLEMMRNCLGYDPLPHLNLLWYEDDANGDDQSELRVAYMDAITKLYSECFTRQLSDWCHAHGVMYIGHIIEDMNCHLRSGVGHYFRALEHQDMSGIDIVLHQVMPGMSDYTHTSSAATGVVFGDFFHYILAKLGASLAHLNPAMEGRAMCEVFGAYGWGEDSPMMKFLIDFLLVRGINRFVPHAFNSRFPDKDCPPHFGAEGRDPSFEAFSALMRYTNRATHLLDGTTHFANAALLYHVDGEWASRFGEASDMQPAAKELYDAHIDFDIIPSDFLASATVEKGRLCIASERFDCLVVPQADHLPKKLIATLCELHDAGLPVWFVDELPENLDFDGVAVALEELVPLMRSHGMTDVEIEEGFPKLRVYHCRRGESDIFMFVNEDWSKTVDTTVKLPCSGEFARIDFLNDAYFGGVSDGSLNLRLLPNQSQIIVFGDRADLPSEPETYACVGLAPVFELSLAESEDMSKYESVGRFDSFFNVNSPKFRPDFSGKMKYNFTFEAKRREGRILLDLGEVGQNATLILNGVDCGIRICRPYAFDVTACLCDGENVAEVVVSNTLVRRVHDSFSYFLQLSPSGLLGGMNIVYKK